MSQKRIDIVPKPAELAYTAGVLRCAGGPEIAGDALFAGEIKLAGEFFAPLFAGTDAASGGWKLTLKEDASVKGAEAYAMSITTSGVGIRASSSAGAFHGLQSLHQLLLDSGLNGCAEIPCAEIADAPRFPWRGLMLDCSRNFFSIDFVKKIIDTLSLFHISVFHWHLTDDQGWRLPVKEFPLLTEIGSKKQMLRVKRYAGGFYTEDEIRGVVEYAASRHIEIVPEVDLPGHTSSVLASYPGLGCTGGPYRVEDRFGIFDDVLCLGNDGIFPLLEAIFDTLARLFPSPYVHLGGDEVPTTRWEACPRCKKRAEELGLESPKRLQSWITAKMVEMLAKRGKKAIGWDEILEDSPQFPLPRDAAVMSWRGSKGGVAASAKGHLVVMSPNTEGCYLDYKHSADPEEPGNLGVCTLQSMYGMDPAGKGMNEAQKALILGGQGNLWCELIYAGKIAEYMIFPRICALAETTWTPPEKKDWEDFKQRLPALGRRLGRLGVLFYQGT